MQKKILILGDIFLDVFQETKVLKISPERPVPVIKPIGNMNLLGGASNVASNIKSIGGEPFLISRLSNDNISKKIISLLNEKKIKHKIYINNKYSSSVKKRIVENNHQFLRIDDEKFVNLSKHHENEIVKYIKKNIKSFDSLIISDYSKGLITKSLLKKIIITFYKNKKKIFTDPKSNNIENYENSNFICPNHNEFNKFLQFEKCTNNKKSIIELFKKSKSEAYIITKGSEGVTIIFKDGKKIDIPQKIINVYDVTGAGDTFIAYTTYLFSKNIDLINSVKIAIYACSKIVQKKHTSTLELNEFRLIIDKFCEENNIDLNLKIKLWKLAKLKIGIANGCFDVLHSGHLHLFKMAKKNCDKLIILVNSDKSVFKLKGKGRPKLKFNTRMQFLKMIKGIDLIENFNEITPLNRIKEIMPSIIFKGSDYKKEDVVGYKEIKKYGGKVIIINNYKNFSSSKLIDK